MDTPVIPMDMPAVDPAIETHYSSRWDEAARLSSTVKGRLEQARLYDFLSRSFPSAPAPSRRHRRRARRPRHMAARAGV